MSADQPSALPPELRERARLAQGHADAADWSAASLAWAQMADRAIELARADVARAALHEAVEALRHDDRPGATLALLSKAIDLAEGRDARAVLKLQLGAALLDAGFPELAEQETREALALAGVAALQQVVADSLAGVLLARGDIIGLRGVVAQLLAESSGITAVSARFREAQLHRLDGRLDRARDGFVAACEALADHPRAAGARAAALSELAELELVRQQPDGALALYELAAGEWERAGRRAGLLGVLAGRAQAILESGATFLPGLLDEPIAYAEARELPALEARLRMARGLCRHAAGSEAADADLEAAILLADTARSPWLAGRIRYERHRCGLAAEADELRRAVDQLTGNQPWYCRATLALAQATLGRDPAEAMRLAGRVLCRFSAMGLDNDRAAAEALIRRAMP